jgi:hypothetical protein
MSTPPMGGTARWKGLRKGRVRAWKNGPTGWCGLVQESTACDDDRPDEDVDGQADELHEGEEQRTDIASMLGE